MDPSQIFEDFLKMSPSAVRARARGLTEDLLSKSVEASVIKNFNDAAQRVPAYKDFLKKNKVDPAKIKTLSDFSLLPMTDKENYLSKYPLNDLAIDGDLGKTTIITMSSGSSGEPFYWPRNLRQDMGIVYGVEAAFLEQFSIDSKKTLLLTSLGLGVWMAGDIMGMASRLLAQKGYDLTLMNPGVDLETNLKILKDIGPLFDQVIISCYPPLAKDIIDSAKKYGVNFKKVNVKFFVGGEPFVEEWRDYILKALKSKSIYEPIMACLGSSEGGVAGNETSVCILVRQLCKSNANLTRLIFNDDRVPSLIQYNPLSKFFESENGQLILTSANGLPLIRYNTKDAGAIMPFSDFMGRLEAAGINVEQNLKKFGASIPWQFPFLYLFGRSDLTATIYGVNIYPENIRGALLAKNIQSLVTGKFFMKTKYDKDGNQILYVAAQLKEGVKSDGRVSKKVKATIVNFLRNNNSEYRKLVQYIGKKADPVLELGSYDSSIFVTQNKLKYIQ